MCGVEVVEIAINAARAFVFTQCITVRSYDYRCSLKRMRPSSNVIDEHKN